MQRLAIAVIALAGAGFLAFGLWLTLDAAAALAGVGIEAANAAGLIELRAFYGGLELGLGSFLLACAIRPDWRPAGLWLTLLGNAGIATVRLIGITATGVFTPFFGWALAWELGFTTLAAAALWLRHRRPQTARGWS